LALDFANQDGILAGVLNKFSELAPAARGWQVSGGMGLSEFFAGWKARSVQQIKFQ